MKLIQTISNRLIQLYKDAFPPEERRPDSEIIPDDGRFCFFTIFDDDIEIGLLTLWRFESFCYIEHFAIFPELKSKGYGSEVLRLVDDPVVLEVEPGDVSRQAASRVEFYKRNGFRELDYDYVQPPYSPELSAVRLRLMARGNLQISAKEITAILHQEVYRQIL